MAQRWDYADALKRGIVSWFAAHPTLSLTPAWRDEAPLGVAKPFVLFSLTGESSERYSKNQGAKTFRVTFTCVSDDDSGQTIAGVIAGDMDGLESPEMILPDGYTLRDFGDPIPFGEQNVRYRGGVERAEIVMFTAIVDGGRRLQTA